MRKSAYIISISLIAASLIIFAASIEGGENNNILSDYHDSEYVEIYINIDSIINESFNEEFFEALDKMDFAFDEPENIIIQIDSINCDGVEIPDLHFDSIDFELDNLDIELDNLDIELGNLDIELDKLKDSLDKKKIVIVNKKVILDSLENNTKKMKIIISENMKNMKDSLKSRMHRFKGDLHRDIRIKCLHYKDFKNMTNEEMINFLKEDGIIESENEVEIERNGDKVVIKITKTKKQ
jgi:hypothetical protein